MLFSVHFHSRHPLYSLIMRYWLFTMTLAHCQLHCLFNSLLILTTYTSSVSLALCEGNPLVASGFPSQRAINVESISMSWRHHAIYFSVTCVEDGETLVKTCNDCWLVAKKSDQREFYVVLNNKNANLIEINGKCDQIAAKINCCLVNYQWFLWNVKMFYKHILMLRTRLWILHC